MQAYGIYTRATELDIAVSIWCCLCGLFTHDVTIPSKQTFLLIYILSVLLHLDIASVVPFNVVLCMYKNINIIMTCH